MIKKSAEMAYASKQIRSPKRLLLACTAFSAAVDIVIIIMLLLGGISGKYLACPFILLIFDIIYFAVSLFFTNFRFKYSLAVWIGYVAFFTLGVGIGAALIFGDEGTVVSNGAAVIWACVHIFSIACAIVTALYASRLVKNKWVAIVVAALFVGVCGGYGVFVTQKGFFGQGVKSRPLVYLYDGSTGSYTVDDVVYGSCNEVDIPSTFNGKPVTAVRARVFAASGVKQYSVHENLTVTMVGELSNSSKLAGRKILARKDIVNNLRGEFFSEAETPSKRAAYLSLANATLPAELDESEGYVSFSYNEQSYAAAGGSVIPTYVGDLSLFDLSEYAKSFDYVIHRNDGSVANFDWASNNGGYIFDGFTVDGAPTEKFEKSAVAEVKFQKVYKVYTAHGNDDKYDNAEVDKEHCNDKLDGAYIGFKYLTADGAKNFMSGYKTRKGFTVEWFYGNGGLNKNALTDLSETLKAYTGDSITLTPLYEIIAPAISPASDKTDNTITYGDGIKLAANASVQAEGVTIKYQWQNTVGLVIGREEELELTPNNSGTYDYILVAYIDGGDVTSLTNTSPAQAITVTVDKKQLDFNWNLTGVDLVYNGEEQGVEIEFDKSQIINGDDVSYQVGGGAERVAWNDTTGGTVYFKGAGDYKMRVNLSGSGAGNYKTNDGSRVTVSVRRKEASVNWTGYENLEYTGRTQCPVASAQGVEADGALLLSVSGGRTGAGDGTATATCYNSNYTLTNEKRPFSIAKKALTVTPAAQTVTYGSSVATSSVINGLAFDGFVQGDDRRDLKGNGYVSVTPALGAGEAYKVDTYPDGVKVGGYTADNYEITYVPAALTITPLKATFSWVRPAGYVVYDGTQKTVTATVSNAVGGDSLAVTLSGNEATDAGEYTATVTGITGARAGNYTFDNETYEWEISKRSLSIVWSDNNVGNSFTYNGKEQGITVKISNLLPEHESQITYSEMTAVNAGEYTARINVTAVIAENYSYTESRLTSAWRIVTAASNIKAYHDGTLIASGSGLTRTINCYEGCVLTWDCTVTPAVTVAYEGGEAVAVSGNSYTFTQAGTYQVVIEINSPNYYNARFDMTFQIRESATSQQGVTENV